jgi:hypothetical protein
MVTVLIWITIAIAIAITTCLSIYKRIQTTSQLQWLGTLNIPPVQTAGLNPHFLRKVRPYHRAFYILHSL